MARYIDNESPRRELDTSKFGMMKLRSVDRLIRAGVGCAKYFGCHFGPSGLIYRMRGNFMGRHAYR
jgi:hypothetical protein